MTLRPSPIGDINPPSASDSETQARLRFCQRLRLPMEGDKTATVLKSQQLRLSACCSCASCWPLFSSSRPPLHPPSLMALIRLTMALNLMMILQAKIQIPKIIKQLRDLVLKILTHPQVQNLQMIQMKIIPSSLLFPGAPTVWIYPRKSSPESSTITKKTRKLAISAPSGMVSSSSTGSPTGCWKAGF